MTSGIIIDYYIDVIEIWIFIGVIIINEFVTCFTKIVLLYNIKTLH